MDIQTYRSLLTLDKHHLDDALVVQADIMERITREVTHAARHEAESKDHLVRLEGKLYGEGKGDNPKATVGEVSAMVQRDPDRLKAFNLHLTAIELHSEWKGLLESWKQRGYAIKTLADLYGANYFSPTSAGRTYEAGTTERARDAMRESRDARAADRAKDSAREAGIVKNRRRVD